MSGDASSGTKRPRKPLQIELRPAWKGHFSAFAGKVQVGSISAWIDSRGEFVVMEVMVRPSYRRRGVATAMYRAVEEQAGMQLKPACSLSDDAFEFWKAYRPEAVAGDLRHRPELVGRRAQKNGRPGTITKASGGTAVLTYDDGMTTVIYAENVDAALLVEDQSVTQDEPCELQATERMRA